MARVSDVLFTSRDRPFAVRMAPWPETVPPAAGSNLDLVVFPPLERLDTELTADHLAIDLGSRRATLFVDRVHATPPAILDGWQLDGASVPRRRER